MFPLPDDKLTRIGVFYDGGYFQAISDYFRYVHPINRRLSLLGLHDFINQKVADAEKVDARYCRIVDAHYFRGRFTAKEAADHGKLEEERAFEDVLIKAGIVTHYMHRSVRGERGIDVWLALEAFELAVYKRFNVLTLIACDGDYLPLVRKLNTLGTRVALFACEFKYEYGGQVRETRVSRELMNAATYVINFMYEVETLQRANRVDFLFL